MLNSFRSRIVVLMVALVAVAEVGTIGPALTAAHRAALDSAEQELGSGAVLFGEILRSRGEQLASSVAVLAADFGFREAVTTGDLATIESALANHSSRIDADISMFFDRDGRMIVSTAGDAPESRSLPGLVDSVQADDSFRSINLLYGSPYELVVVPVNAPLRVGWTGMGFRLDDALAAELRELTGLEVSFVGIGERGVKVFASTLPAADQAVELPQAPFSEQAEGRFFSETITLYENGSERLAVLLQLPVTRMFADFEGLRLQLLLLAGLSLLICCGGAIVLGRQISRPVARLAEGAQRIADGDYMSPVEVVDGREFGLLARAFNRMQSGIAEREARIIHQAEHDTMTGLPNRRGIGGRLQAAIRDADVTGAGCALLVLDIDRLKEINDALGHEVGDQAIIAVADQLRASTRAGDTVVRLGGDEFLIVLAGADETRAYDVAADLVTSLSDSVSLGSLSVSLRVSIGIAIYPVHASDADKLLRRADIAMYAAKHADDHVSCYVDGDDERHLRRIAIVNGLQQEIELDGFDIHYQPKLDLGSGRIAQVEALIRWEDTGLGHVGPDEFIPLAEQSGNIRDLTQLLLRRVIAQLRDWHLAGYTLSAAVNLSAHDLLDRSLPAWILAELAARDLPSAALIVEVTESAVMHDARRAVRVLEELRAAGIGVSIDDFGTGQSSLAQLKKLPVDELKIDRSFVMNMPGDPDDAVICRSTIELGHQLGLSITAEGVESDDALAMLSEFGCDMAQGYLISRPLPAAELVRWLGERDSVGPLADDHAGHGSQVA